MRAGLKQPVEAIRHDYERETGQTVLVQYGGSNTLLANLKLTGEADLFLPADDSYIELARRDNLVGQTTPLARMRPVLVVKKGDPLGIKSLSDLLSGTARISMTDPEAAATGKLVREALTKAGQWDAFQSRVTVFKPSVTDVANDLKLGAVDAGVIWDAMLTQYPDLIEVPLPELAGVEARVVVGGRRKSSQPAAAAKLAGYLASEKARRHWQAGGFVVESAEAREVIAQDYLVPRQYSISCRMPPERSTTRI